MKKNEELKNWIILILVGVVSYWVINNINIFIYAFSKFISVLSPFIIGIALAYILNIPMIKIETNLKKRIKNNKFPIRIVSIILSVLIFVVIIGIVLLMLVPELIENIELLIQNIPMFISDVESWIVGLVDSNPDMQIEIEKIFEENANVSNILVSILNYVLNGSVSFISGLFTGVFKVFTSFIFAIYMLSQKEYLQSSIKKLIYVYIPKKKADKIMEIGNLSNNVFSKFISGQCLDAVILGGILFAVLSIFGFPYALLISVLTSITALIPIFGAFIAAGVGALLIFITNPLQAAIFVLVFLVVQQIEGNFIYPKVVGKSVGLSPLLTLLAITVGGGLFGIVGMLIGLPIASIVYSLLANDANKRMINKKNF